MVPLWISSRPNLSAAARPAQNRPGSDPSLVEEDIDLALQCGAAIGTALLGELQGVSESVKSLRCAFSANSPRTVAIKRALEPIERAAAKQRQGMRGDRHPEKFSTSSNGRALDKVAAVVGVHRTTIAKAEAIVDAAEAEPDRFGKLLADMDRPRQRSPAELPIGCGRRSEWSENPTMVSQPRPGVGFHGQVLGI
jgi:hypothetical protein